MGSRMASALWTSLSRPAWVLSWLIWTLAWYFDYLPFTNAIFSHWVFAPLSSLTYGAYLIHPVIIKLIAGNAEDYYTFSPCEAIHRAIFFFVLAYGASVALWCLVEKPMASLTSLMVPKARQATKPRAATGEGAAGVA